MPYSEQFKSRMIQRLTGPSASSARSLSREVGVSQATLSRWLRGVRRLPSMTTDRTHNQPQREPNSAKSPNSWSAEEKYRVVMEAASVPDNDLGEFLRRKGLHSAQLEEWRAVVAEAAKAALTSGKQRSRKQLKTEARRIHQLERELARKEKALAEMAALVALKKKLDLLWGDEDESTRERNER